MTSTAHYYHSTDANGLAERQKCWCTTVRRHLAGLAVSCFAGLCTFITIYNNLFAYGATLYDSTFFSTILWRSGWGLHVGTAIANGDSFYHTHSSPIHYIPVLISYIFPGDFISYYALVYGFVYASLTFASYYVVQSVIPGRSRAVAGAAAGLAAYCSQVVFQGAWEMRMEAMPMPLSLLAFYAWQVRQYWAAGVWLVLAAMVREDVGIIDALPLAMLAWIDYRRMRPLDPVMASERLRMGSMLAGLSLFVALLSWTVPRLFISNVQYMQYGRYFDPTNPLGHLQWDILLKHVWFIFREKTGLWLPLVTLAIGAAVLHDTRLLVGAIGFLPFLIALLISRDELSAKWECYKPFSMFVAMLWPALMALDQSLEKRKRYLWLQCIVLASGLSYVIANPPEWTYNEMERRWVLQPMVNHRYAYDAFSEYLNEVQVGRTRASMGVLALYPYHFSAAWNSGVMGVKEGQENEVDTLIWFQDDREQQRVNQIMADGHYQVYAVPNTKIWVAYKEGIAPPQNLPLLPASNH